MLYEPAACCVKPVQATPLIKFVLLKVMTLPLIAEINTAGLALVGIPVPEIY